MIVLSALSSVNDISDTDLILVEKSTGEGFKMTGADLKKFINAQAVDTVALNNMQSVTSNAVSRVCPRFLNYANIITLSSGVTTWQATEDCFVIVNQLTSAGKFSIEIDNIEVGTSDTTSNITLNSFSGYLKKGQTIKFDYLYNTNFTRIFLLI